MLAFSDGAKEDDHPNLLPRPIAFPLFTLVVNREAGVEDLSLEQIRQIYNGRILNWRDVGGSDLPVRLVGRPQDSGTRKTFEKQILAGRWEPARNSDDCLEVARGAPAGVVQCERPTTGDVLNTVAATPGGLGYSELGAASGRENLLLLRIDGHEATLEGADYGAYPFWETEYVHLRAARGRLPGRQLSALSDPGGRHGHHSLSRTPPVRGIGEPGVVPSDVTSSNARPSSSTAAAGERRRLRQTPASDCAVRRLIEASGMCAHAGRLRVS